MTRASWLVFWSMCVSVCVHVCVCAHADVLVYLMMSKIGWSLLVWEVHINSLLTYVCTCICRVSQISIKLSEHDVRQHLNYKENKRHRHLAHMACTSMQTPWTYTHLNDQKDTKSSPCWHEPHQHVNSVSTDALWLPNTNKIITLLAWCTSRYRLGELCQLSNSSYI